MLRALLTLALLLLTGTPALSADASCPPPDLLAPLPDTQNVELRQASVSSANYPGAWQQGQIGKAGFSYRLFVNATGTVSDNPHLTGWRVEFACDLSKGKCSYRSFQGPPEDAVAAAKKIGECLIRKPPKPEEKPKDKPKEKEAAKKAVEPPKDKAAKPADPPKDKTAKPVAPPKADMNASPKAAEPAKKPASPPVAGQVVGSVVTKPAGNGAAKPQAATTQPKAAAAAAPTTVPKGQQAASPGTKSEAVAGGAGAPAAKAAGSGPAAKPICYADTLPIEPIRKRTQRLLLLAGSDPGPIDGTFGRKTLEALEAVFGKPTEGMAPEAINADLLDLICNRK